eukprot:TRINITY_DN6517_c0_g1_i1.p1 TRINITY_DN6517_c0_g1~~TRINITY_DN6517_c0_g1_i1.p1  ORF type:complete len:242 (+),score=43.80 TRINITY_DN6517_c0_g1_i1:216-941(+)
MLRVVGECVEEVMGFGGLVESLVAGRRKGKGAAVLVPETVLFSGGKAKCFAYFDKKTKEMKGVYNKASLDLQYLMKVMTGEYRKRKSQHPVLKLKFKNEDAVEDKEETQTVLPMVIVRHDNKRVELVQAKFTELMLKNPNSKVWKEIQCIQNCVVIGNAVAGVLKYIYTAPIDIKNPNTKIKYTQKENTKATNIDYKAYAFCNNIAYYLAKNYAIVLSYSKGRKFYICRYSSSRIAMVIFG